MNNNRANIKRPTLPCSGKVCAGKCNGPCPVGFRCQKNNFGIFRCIQEPPTIWEKWWFWLLLIIGIFLIILIVYLIYKAATPKVKTGTEVIKPPPAYNPAMTGISQARPANIGLPTGTKINGIPQYN